MDDIVSYYQAKSFNTVFPEVGKVLQIYLVAPISSATAERSFSTLRRTKTWLRSTQGALGVTALALMQIESDILHPFDTDGIVKQSASKTPRRLQFYWD